MACLLKLLLTPNLLLCDLSIRLDYGSCLSIRLYVIIIGSSYNFRFRSFFCVLHFIRIKLSVKVKLFVSLLCVCAILPAKAVPEMTYTVSGRTLNPAHSLTCNSRDRDVEKPKLVSCGSSTNQCANFQLKTS